MRTFAATFAAALLLAASAQAAPAPAEEWPTYGHDYGDARHSPLSQITPANVTQLQPVWTYHMRPAPALGLAPTGFSASQNTPLVVNGVLYLSTPYSRVVALDAETGRELWAYTVPQAGDDPATRGVAYWPGGRGVRPRIVFGTREGQLIALDAATGAPATGFGVNGVVGLKTPDIMNGFPDAYLGVTSAPAIYGDLVIVGSRTQEAPQQGANGAVRAFDLRTGREVWRFSGVPGPGERFHDTWTGDSWVKRSGVNVWAGMTLDDRRGIVYLPFGAPTFDQSGGDRTGESLFANTLVALDARTGKYLWHFQALRHDLWDYDLPLTTLLEVKKGGRTIPAIAVMSKASLLFLLDRVTGKPIFPIRQVPVPTETDMVGEVVAPTQPMSVTPPLGRTSFTMDDLADITPEHTAACRKLIQEMTVVPAGYFQPPRADSAVARFPGNWGGIDWGHASYDPQARLYVVNSKDMGSQQYMVRKADGSYGMRDGYQWFWDRASRMPCQKPPWGTLFGIDVDTAQIVWRSTLGVTDGLADPNTGRPSVAGPITTAGGLTFIGGTDDKRLRAFETRTGRELWSAKLPASIYAHPITYRGRNGRQYVAAVITGGFWGEAVGADEVTAFALPERQ